MIASFGIILVEICLFGDLGVRNLKCLRSIWSFLIRSFFWIKVKIVFEFVEAVQVGFVEIQSCLRDEFNAIEMLKNSIEEKMLNKWNKG